MDGLERPCIGGAFVGLAPRTVMVDMGSNVDCRPALLLSFGALGAGFVKRFMGIENPRVGLLSVGSEEAKGNRQVQESYHLFQESSAKAVSLKALPRRRSSRPSWKSPASKFSRSIF